MDKREIIARLRHLEDEALRLELKIRDLVLLLKEDVDSEGDAVLDSDDEDLG